MVLELLNNNKIQHVNSYGNYKVKVFKTVFLVTSYNTLPTCVKLCGVMSEFKLMNPK